MNHQLRVELETMYDADQAIRIEGMQVAQQHGPDSPEFAALRDRGRALDATHRGRLVEIIEEHGWPGTSLVGEKARNGAFLVLQHADAETQKRYVPVLREATDQGEMPPSALALLEDRIRVRDGKPQVDGSQITRGPDGLPTPWEIEDRDHVDERRAAVGLEPLAQYLERFQQPPGA